MNSVNITVETLVEKLVIIAGFYKHDIKARDIQFNAIRFMVGDEIYDEAVSRLKKINVI